MIIASAETSVKILFDLYLLKNLTETLYYITSQAQITNGCLKNSFGIEDCNKVPPPLLL